MKIREADHKPLAEKGAFVILAPILLVGLGVVVPLLIFAVPLFAFLLGPLAIWKGGSVAQPPGRSAPRRTAARSSLNPRARPTRVRGRC